jgi:DNA mismatch repair protein MutL
LTISVLPDDVASAIAAGEVVERPSSVVKELIENSLDAGSAHIRILTEGGGVKRVEVSDDGEGIPSAEVALAMERFSTSKLRSIDDLFSIGSLGFRGEALSSIAAVSRLVIRTRTQAEAAGTELAVEGGILGDPVAIGVSPGTTVQVRDLFMNVPARKKFLKSETTERRRITTLITRYAMAYPAVAFHLVHDGREAFQSLGTGDRREVLAAVFGVEVSKELIALEESQESLFTVHGYVSPPSLSRGTRKDLTFFVNGRWVSDTALSASVIQAYHTLLMVGKFPIAAVFLEMPPEMVDVNVHPAKSEVRFRDPALVFSMVQRAVRATLLGQAPVPSAAIPTIWRAGDPPRDLSAPSGGWAIEQREDGHQGGLQPGLPSTRVQILRAVGQVGASYLVAEGPDGVYLIDQHAAHERVLYERMMLDVRDGEIESQRLLEARTIAFSPSQSGLIEDQMDQLLKIGFELEPFGDRTYKLRSVPAISAARDPEQILRATVDEFEEDETPFKTEVEAKLIARICKRTAIKAGQVLSIKEQEELIRALESCASPRTCPHGRPTMIHISVASLDRQFGRT